MAAGELIVKGNGADAAFRAKMLLESPGLCAGFVETGDFPLSEERATRLTGCLLRWLESTPGLQELPVALWIQTAAMSSAEAANRIAEQGQVWMPVLGVGVRPGGEPPRMLRKDDLAQLRWNQSPTLRHEGVLHVSAGMRAALGSLPRLLGEGGVVMAAVAGVDTYLEAQRAAWLPRISDPAFRAHSFYMPLMSRREMERASRQQLLEALGTAQVYLCESPGDGGILVLCATEAMLRSLAENLQADGR